MSPWGRQYLEVWHPDLSFGVLRVMRDQIACQNCACDGFEEPCNAIHIYNYLTELI